MHVIPPAQFDVGNRLVLLITAEEGVEVVWVEELVGGGDQVEELVEGVRPLCDCLRLEVPQQHL